jgi:hypothetical protein
MTDPPLSTQKYLRQLQRMVRARHGCAARHITTTPVADQSRGRMAWHGNVEVFDLLDHPAAQICYAWSYEEGGLTHVTVMLGVSPVDSAEAAVNVAFDAKAGLSGKHFPQILPR